jgi:putative ABC transport system permease protein
VEVNSVPSEKRLLRERFFRMLVRAFPFDFQANYGGEMASVFREQQREAETRGGTMGVLRLWAETLAGIFRTAPREHWEILKQDCSYAFRTMHKNRGFTLIAILTLALGIGANTAIFSVVHSVLLNPLPYRQDQQLIFLRAEAEKVGPGNIKWSVPEIMDYRQQNRTLSSLVEFHSMNFILYGHGDPDRVKTGVVSWNYFDMFGVQPILGRNFTPADDVLGAPAVLLLSYDYWRRDFGGDRAVVGKTVKMNDKVHTIVGVLPPIPQYPLEEDVYMPTSACPFRSSHAMIVDRDARMMDVFGRLKPGVTLGQAQADLAATVARLTSAYPKSYPRKYGYTVVPSALKSDLTRRAQPTLLVLLAAAGFVLLIACANVANLTLSRLARRERELAVRTALGAGHSRLLRQLLTESLILALIGGAAGLLLAYDSLGLLTDFAARLTPRAREIHVDGGVLLFAFAIAVGVSVIFGTLAAMSARRSLSSGLKEGSAGAGAGRRSTALRGVLVAAQFAFSFMLLIGAGLLLRSLYRMLQVNPGFAPEYAMAMTLNYNWSEFGSAEKLGDRSKKLLDHIEAQPGVIAAGLSSAYPLEPEIVAHGPSSTSFQIEGRPLGPNEVPPMADAADVSPDYFRALGIPLIKGREFTAADDANAPRVVIIDQAMERRFWPSDDAIGQRVSFDDGKNWWQIVGVVGSVRDAGVEHTPLLQAYGPLAQASMNLSTLVVRTAADPARMGTQLTRAIHDVDPQMAVSQVITLDQALSESVAAPRVTASLLGLFAGLALLIAVAGIGGIMALSVSQRVREIGIRMALGAQPSGIMRMLVGQGLALALAGVGIGLIGALALTRLLKSLLFEVAPNDPATFAGVAIVLLGAAVVAILIPARRAAAIDPNVALRCE